MNSMDIFTQIAKFIPSELGYLFPEIFLSAGILFAMGSEFLRGGKRRGTLRLCGLVAFCSFVLSLQPLGRVAYAGFCFEPDALSQFVRIVVSLGALLAIGGLAGSGTWKNRPESGEAGILILSVALGAMLFSSAANLLSLLLSLEFLSLSSYGLAGFHGRDRSSAEAGLKYVLYGGVASAVALFGMSHVFGMTGTLSYAGVGQILAMGGADKAVLVPLLLVGVAFGYKLALVPFHFWGPDVYQGCPAVSAGFLSTVPKTAGFVGLIHFLLSVFPDWTPLVSGTMLPTFLAVFGIVSTVVGAVAAGMQKDARRTLAFSSTSNAGTMLIVLSSWITIDAVAALGFFLLVYLFANFGAFLALDRLETESGSSTFESLAGSWKRRPWTVAGLTFCLVSLAGIPPLAGFTAKWAILREVLRVGLDGGLGIVTLVAAVAILISSVCLVWAYLRIVRAAVVDDPEKTHETVEFLPLSGTVLGFCSLAVLFLGWGWPVLDLLRKQLGG